MTANKKNTDTLLNKNLFWISKEKTVLLLKVYLDTKVWNFPVKKKCGI